MYPAGACVQPPQGWVPQVHPSALHCQDLGRFFVTMQKSECSQTIVAQVYATGFEGLKTAWCLRFPSADPAQLTL
jgi:hypothetical protein